MHEDDVAYTDADEYVESIYANLPLCFQNGDIIKAVGNKRLSGLGGIFHVSPNRDEQIKRLLAMNCTPDDEELVEFMDEDGEFSHIHLLVTELELAETGDIPDDQMSVLDCASSLVKGTGTIDALQYSIIGMKRKRGRIT